MKFFIAVLFLALAGRSLSQVSDNITTHSSVYTDGKALVDAIYNRYAPDKWYRNFTFSQNTEFFRNDSVVKREVWHEAYQPGCLIIKVGTKDSKTGRVYRDFMVHSFTDGKETAVTPRVHELLLVGLDVYFFKPQRTIQLLDSLGYNLSKIRKDEVDGRKVFVVGADKGDETSKQFWIDAERLYMHRIIYGQKGKMNDVVFSNYKKIKGNWVATTVDFKLEGKLMLQENYFDIKFPARLDPSLFDYTHFNRVSLK